MPYPDDETRPTDLREFFAVLRRRKWSVILPTPAGRRRGAGVGVMRGRLSIPRPHASRSFPRRPKASCSPSYGNQFMNMDTESARVTSTPIQSGAADLLVKSGQSAALATEAGVSVSVPSNTTYLDITCTTEMPATAQACAQAYADAYVADRTASVNEAVAVLRRPIEDKIARLTQTIIALETQIAATTDPEARAAPRGHSRRTWSRLARPHSCAWTRCRSRRARLPRS